MNFTNYLLEQLNQLDEVKTIVLIDGNDPRMQQAAQQLVGTKKIKPILLFEGNKIDLPGVESIDILANKNQISNYAETFYQMRNGKETKEAALEAMHTRPFYAMMMLKEKKCHGVVGGLLYVTADILRAAFKVIGTKPGIKTISSIMIMHKKDDVFLFTDVAIIINPSTEQLVDIAKNASNFADVINIQEKKMAFLSFSTKGSANSVETKKVQEATKIFNDSSNVLAVGEIQFDAAIDEKVRIAKYKDATFHGAANILIFPSLEAGNIGCKIAQKLGDYGAIGGILVGTNQPVNDLSRGALVEDVVYTSIITALQAK